MQEDDLIDQIIGYTENLIRSGQQIPPELIRELTAFVQEEIERSATQPDIPRGAENLWELSGGSPSIFEKYLSNYPDPSGSFKNLLSNPQRLNKVIEKLDTQYPPGAEEPIDGFSRATPPSSNVYGFQYNPRTKEMLVRFNSGSIYHYEGVPEYVFRLFQQGAAPAKTSGKNEYGQWWRGKSPSLGAAFAEYIRNKPFPYQRVA